MIIETKQIYIGINVICNIDKKAKSNIECLNFTQMIWSLQVFVFSNYLLTLKITFTIKIKVFYI